MQRFGGSTSAGIHVFLRAEFSGQRCFVPTATDRNGTKAHLARVLNTQVTQPADALNSYQVAPTRSGIAQRVVNSDACAKQRGSLVGRQVIGNRGHGLGGRDHVFGVTAIEAEAGDLAKLAKKEVATAAGIAFEAVSAMPTYAHTLARLPVGYVRSNRVDAPGDLMPRHARILDSRPESFFHQSIAVADAACFDLDPHLPASGLRDRALDHFKIFSRFADLHGFHGRHLSIICGKC